MIEVKLREILESQEAMRHLSEKSLRGRTAYQLGRLMKKLEGELSTYNEVRQKLIEKYAKRKDDGSFEVNERNEYQFTPENMQAYIEEINKLIEEEVQIEASPINLDDLGDIEFTPAEMSMLDPFIQE